MKVKFILRTFFILGLMSMSFLSYSAGCWVYSWQTQNWYYFPTVCCSSFVINWELGDQCYNDPSCVAFSGNAVENRATEVKNRPSLSSLSKICSYEIKMGGNGEGTIFTEKGRIAVLTAEGLHDFFSNEACFYYSNEVKMEVIDGNLIPIDTTQSTPGIKVKNDTKSSYAVPLGKLDVEQVEMIKIIGQPVAKELRQEYDLNIIPNPANDQIQVLFKSNKDQKVSIDFINLNGNKLFSSGQNAIRGLNSFAFDIKGFNPGTYFIILGIDGIKISQKVIKS